MRSIKKKILFILAISTATFALAQDIQDPVGTNYQDLAWKQVALQMPDAWYGSDEAKSTAENVLLYQFNIGGWPKNKKFNHPMTDAERSVVVKEKSGVGATFDNGATINEIIFLAKVYTTNRDERYRKAIEQGLHYIFESQYANGGWPQFYPNRTAVNYASHITYNDNAMVNVMTLLKDIVDKKTLFEPLQISDEIKTKAKESFERGVSCILKTQIIVHGKPTVWCAQHDEFTFAPAMARAYELSSYSGSESVGIILLLMDIDNPSPSVKEAVINAVKWFDANKIEGIKIDTEIDKDGRKNKIVVEDKSASAIWARFYDLQTGKPFFCDRDGIKKNTLDEIGYERRNGYMWYTTSPEKLFKKYQSWSKKMGI